MPVELSCGFSISPHVSTLDASAELPCGFQLGLTNPDGRFDDADWNYWPWGDWDMRPEFLCKFTVNRFNSSGQTGWPWYYEPDIPCQLFVRNFLAGWEEPEIAAEDWAGIIMIDPNNLRPAEHRYGPSPIRVDSFVLRPGLTDKHGSFIVAINDNPDNVRNAATGTTLFNRYEVLDNDEIWIGVQQGPGTPDTTNTWVEGTGGWYWLMGGFITRRYNEQDEDGRITAFIEGDCYMKVWRQNFIGTPEIPRTYDNPQDFGSFASTILTDVNAQQDADYQFTASPSYWPGVAPIPPNTGIEWLKEFNMDDAFSLMRDGCEQAGWDWQIVPYPPGATPKERRVVMLYPRDVGAPISVNARIAYDLNIREAPRILTGSVQDYVTNILISGKEQTVPEIKSQWSVRDFWEDAYVSARVYDMFSVPRPPNASLTSGAKWADTSQIIDDDGYPAVNFQREGEYRFYPVFKFFTNQGGKPEAATFPMGLALDLRKWRRLKFKFKHSSRTGAGSIYRVKLHTFLDPSGPPNEWLSRAISYNFASLITNTQWTAIDLELPKLNADGTIANWNGWDAEYPNPSVPASAYDTADPTQIDFLSFQAWCLEPDPGVTGYVTVTKGVNQGHTELQVPNPGDYFYRGTNFPGASMTTGEIVFNDPKPVQLGSETVHIFAINGPYHEDRNVRLASPAASNHPAGSSIRISGGYSISFSQIHFELPAVATSVAATLPAQLQNPKRYRIVSYPEAEFLHEAAVKAEQELANQTVIRRALSVVIDALPTQRIGYLMNPQLDPIRYGDGETDLIFHLESMITEDIEYIVADIDFSATLVLSPLDSRVRDYSYYRTSGLHTEKIRNVEMMRKKLDSRTRRTVEGGN